MVDDHTTRRALLGALGGSLALGAGCLDGDDANGTGATNATNATNATLTTEPAGKTAEPTPTQVPRPPGADRLASAGTDVACPKFRYSPSDTGAASGAIDLRSQPRRVWSHELPGEAYAPVVSEGMVFVALRRHRTDQPSLFALAADTGQVVWSVDLGTAATGPPTLFEAEGTRRLYVADRQGYIQALNPMTGKQDWRADVSDERALVPSTRPAQRIVTGGPGAVVELDAATGKQRWQRDIEGEIAAPPATTESRIFLVTRPVNGNRDVIAVNPLHDREDWRSRSLYAGDQSAVVRNGLVYLAGPRGVEARDIATGTQQWSEPVSTDALPAVTPTKVVLRQSSDVVALDASNGREEWRRSVGYAEDPPAPTVGGSTVYAGGYETFRESIALDLGSGVVLWTVALDSGWANAPAIPVDVGLYQTTGGTAKKPYEIHAFTIWE
ncbi:MAG: PQQ-binding-like beta-propeller repeat protein [Halococcoides sp.]